MAEYKLTNKAVEDLNQIWGYTIYKYADYHNDGVVCCKL